jgi:hypothetical protein
MFNKMLTALFFALTIYQSVAEVCLPAFTDCPTDVCTDESTTLCGCPSTDTYCDFSHETCAGTYGNCIQIKTITVLEYDVLYTVTNYVATVSTYSTINTEVDTVTSVQTDSSDVTSTITQVRLTPYFPLHDY